MPDKLKKYVFWKRITYARKHFDTNGLIRTNGFVQGLLLHESSFLNEKSFLHGVKAKYI